MIKGIAQHWKDARNASQYLSLHLTIDDRDEFVRGHMEESPWAVLDGEPYDTDLSEREERSLRRSRESEPTSYHRRHWAYGSWGPWFE